MELKKNAVFQKIAPFFPQLKLGDGMPQDKPENVATDAPDSTSTRVSAKNSAKDQAAPVAKMISPMNPQTSAKGNPAALRMAPNPAVSLPKSSASMSKKPGITSSQNPPQGIAKLPASQLPPQKTLVLQSKPAAPPAKKVEETAKRSTTPNKH